MVEKKGKADWRCDGKTVQGASHVRTGLPNQDAIRWWPKLGSGPPLILAVSDGHGSAKSFRSSFGAKIAVELATKELRESLQLLDEQPDLNANISSRVQTELPKILVKKWQDAVKNELGEKPFTSDEWASLEKKDGSAACLAVKKNPFLAYGATLLAVVVTEHFILYLQLGDGDILCVDTKGKTTHPIPRNEKLIANETTSLCLPNAWQEVQVELVRYSENPPALILVSTDGYSNSFRSEADFLMIGQDYREMIRSTGIDDVQKQLTSILEETSQQGSGDDITLGMIKRIEKGDADYTESVLSKTKIELQNQLEEHKGHISDIDIKLNNLDYKYNKLSKDFKLLKLCGFGVAFFLTVLMIGGFAADFWIWSKISKKESTANKAEEVKSTVKSAEK